MKHLGATNVLKSEIQSRISLLKDHQLMSVAHSLSSMNLVDDSAFSQLRADVTRRGERLDRKYPISSNSFKIKNPNKYFSIVKESDDYMVIFKPKNIVVSLSGDLDDESESGRRSGGNRVTGKYPELQNIVCELYGAALPIASDASFAHGIMHRLDRLTTGALLIAKTYRAFYDLRLQFACNLVHKEYLCVVQGILGSELDPPNTGWKSITNRILTSKLQPGGNFKQHSRVLPKSDTMGQSALTEYRVIKHLRVNQLSASVVSVKLHTGRAHQIRAHMASIGHPLLFDVQYGAEPSVSDFMLHASEVSFIEPGADERIKVEVTCPFSDFGRQN